MQSARGIALQLDSTVNHRRLEIIGVPSPWHVLARFTLGTHVHPKPSHNPKAQGGVYSCVRRRSIDLVLSLCRGHRYSTHPYTKGVLYT